MRQSKRVGIITTIFISQRLSPPRSLFSVEFVFKWIMVYTNHIGHTSMTYLMMDYSFHFGELLGTSPSQLAPSKEKKVDIKCIANVHIIRRPSSLSPKDSQFRENSTPKTPSEASLSLQTDNKFLPFRSFLVSKSQSLMSSAKSHKTVFPQKDADKYMRRYSSNSTHI